MNPKPSKLLSLHGGFFRTSDHGRRFCTSILKRLRLRHVPHVGVRHTLNIMHASFAAVVTPSRLVALFPVRSRSSRRCIATRTRAAAGPITVTVVKGGASTDIPGDGGIVGTSSSCDATVGGEGVDDEHAKLEVRQGRIFVTALSRTAGTFLGEIVSSRAWRIPSPRARRWVSGTRTPRSPSARRTGARGRRVWT